MISRQVDDIPEMQPDNETVKLEKVIVNLMAAEFDIVVATIYLNEKVRGIKEKIDGLILADHLANNSKEWIIRIVFVDGYFELHLVPVLEQQWSALPNDSCLIVPLTEWVKNNTWYVDYTPRGSEIIDNLMAYRGSYAKSYLKVGKEIAIGRIDFV